MSEKEVVVLGLLSGEKIVASVEFDQNSIIVTEALEILVHMEDDGRFRMGLTEWMPFTKRDAGISVPLGSTVIAVPNEELRKAHAKTFSKIITPDTPSLILPS